MAWGIFNKIKKGLKSIGDKVISGAKWVNDKVLKPVLPLAGQVIDNFIPNGSKYLNVISNGIDKASDFRDSFNSKPPPLALKQDIYENDIVPRFRENY